MTGYNHLAGMSNNAVAAYADGVKPLSRITLDDLRDAGWDRTKKLAFHLAKSGAWKPSEWHHSGGTWYNKVDFYNPCDLVEAWGEMTVEDRALAERETEPREKTKDQPVKGSFTIWGGTRKHPRPLGTREFTGVLVGKWIHIDGGGGRKKADGNHITWMFV